MLATWEAKARAYREMTWSNRNREDDTLFESIEMYDGLEPSEFECWLDDMDQATWVTNRDLRKELIKKSGGVMRQTLMMMDPGVSDDEVIAKLRKDFSTISTMN